MASLQTLGADKIGDATGQSVEVHTAVVVVEKERVVKRRCFAGQAEGLIVTQHTKQDEVCQDRLFLLPPCLSVVPDKSVMVSVWSDCALHHVIPATTLAIGARIGHDFRNLPSQRHIFLLPFERHHAHEVPGDLEVVTDDSTVLLPAPRLIVTPIFEETLLHKGAVLIILKAVRDRIERVL